MAGEVELFIFIFSHIFKHAMNNIALLWDPTLRQWSLGLLANHSLLVSIKAYANDIHSQSGCENESL